jgi:hypothetical protein
MSTMRANRAGAELPGWPARMKRAAANIAKLPDLLRKP